MSIKTKLNSTNSDSSYQQNQGLLESTETFNSVKRDLDTTITIPNESGLTSKMFFVFVLDFKYNIIIYIFR